MIQILYVLILFVSAACGVKGRPQPPLNPPSIGRGEPNFSKATEKVKLPKKKANPAAPADDWEESEDFSPSEDE